MTENPRVARAEAGFTLVEILLAVMIASMAMVAVTSAFVGTLRTHYEIDNLTSSTEAGQRVLALLERDIQGIWHFNVKRNAVLRGRDSDIGGNPADRIDMLTSTDAVGGVVGTKTELSFPGLCEVGYWLKPNPEQPGLLELWRREDPLVDDNLLSGGRFQLVTDRLKSFDITYYETLGYEAEPFQDWDSSQDGRLPRRIKIEFTLHRRIGNRNEIVGTEVEEYEQTLKTYVRHIVLDPRYVDILQAGVAMIPTAPRAPEAAAEAASGGGGAGAAGGGPGAGGAKLPDLGEVSTSGGDARGAGRQGGNRAAPTPGNPNRPPIDFRDLLRGGAGGLFGGSGGFPGGFPGAGGGGGGGCGGRGN